MPSVGIDEYRAERPSGATAGRWFTGAMSLVLRSAAAGDVEFLIQMLIEAVNWRPGRLFSRERIMSDPASARYVVGWPRIGDLGTIAEASEGPVGAVWLRLLPSDDAGFGFVAADIPELSIAVVAGRRGQGIGRLLLRAAITQAHDGGYRGISLAVERDNPALALYSAEGFGLVRIAGNRHHDAPRPARRSHPWSRPPPLTPAPTGPRNARSCRIW